MLHFEKSVTLPYSAQHLYDIVSNVENYNQFVPWCSNIRMIEQGEYSFTAEVLIDAFGMMEKYISHVKLEPLANGIARIIATSDSAPFQNMKSEWIFKELDVSFSKIDFSITFQLRSKILNTLVGSLLPLACDKMMNAFIKKASDNAHI